ncbi:MAG: hypothetical protein O2795_09510, partial [Acidobacteria bacterium]|nr:hypothetical protein [Acidobacteriota bacterium]
AWRMAGERTKKAAFTLVSMEALTVCGGSLAMGCRLRRPRQAGDERRIRELQDRPLLRADGGEGDKHGGQVAKTLQ